MTPAHLRGLQWAVNQACSRKAQREADDNDRGAAHRRLAQAAREGLKELQSSTLKATVARVKGETRTVAVHGTRYPEPM